jgi:type IV pilus assembly protein PilQ
MKPPMRLRHLVAATALALALPMSPLVAADTPPGGETITIETSERPLEQVLQWISRRANVNIVCNEPDQPRISLRLVNVTWQEAVEQIARKHNYVIERKSDRLWLLTNPLRVRMELQDAPLTKVMEAIARQAGVNIVISDDIDSQKKVTMVLQGVPWREALDVVVKASGYAWIEQDYSIIRIISRDMVQQDLETKIFRLNYATADGMKTVIEAQLGQDGTVITDPRSNSLIITATPPALDKATKTIETLDARTRQVLIEMKFVEFATTDAQTIGFDPLLLTMDIKDVGSIGFGSSPFSQLPALVNGVPFNGTVTGGTAQTGFGREAGNLPTSGGIRTLSANMVFEMLSKLNSTEILQSPQLLTLDNTEAEIQIGREIRYAEATQTAQDGNVTTTLSEAGSSPVKDGITVKIRPTITGDGFVLLNLETLNEEAQLQTFSSGQGDTQTTIQLPQKDRTSLKSVIMVGDGRTGVIGGLLRNKTVEDDRKVPLLGDIPVLGWLFKKKTDEVQQRNLTIFITPRIVPMGQESEYDQRKAEIRSRLSGIKPAAPVEPTTAP